MTFLPTDRVMLQALRASKIRGVQLAIVVDNKDGDGNPGYRVKLKLPWLSEQDTTFWARIAIPMGGPDRGTYLLPEVDDQVLVVFEHGDINRPIVIGGLWNQKQEPVEVNQSGKNNTKLIKSRCGHRVIFDDKDGAEKITIVDKTNKNKIILDSVNKLVKIESDGDIEVKAKANVILHTNSLKIGTKEGVTGKGASLLTHAAKTFGLKATNGITIGGGNTTINTSNAAATSVSGSGAGELGGVAAVTANDQTAGPNAAGDGAEGDHSGGGGGGGVAGLIGAMLVGATPVAAAVGAAQLASVPIGVVPVGDLLVRVIDDLGAAVDGADVAVHGVADARNGLSVATGDASFVGLPPGRYNVATTKAGFIDGTSTAAVEAGMSTSVTVQLVRITLEAFIRFEAWDMSASRFVALDNLSVDALDDGTLTSTTLDSCTSDGSGVSHFVVTAAKRAAGRAIDLVFLARPAARVVGGVKLPDKWSTKGWDSTTGVPGRRERFTGSTIGTSAAPLVFRIGLDFHLRIMYDTGQVGSTTTAAPPGVTVVLQRDGLVQDTPVGEFVTDARGEVHGLTFLAEPGESLRVDVEKPYRDGVVATITNPSIQLPETKFMPKIPIRFWRSAKGDPDSKLIENNRATSLGTQASPAVFKGTGERAAAMYIFKILSEWQQFLFLITKGTWKGIPDLKIFPHTAGGTSYSFPAGEVNLEPRNFFDRGTIAHELSHQIMWQESHISSMSIVGKVLSGHLHLFHTENLLSDEQTHPLIEGWAEFMEAVFTGSGYSVAMLRDDVSKPATQPLGPPPANRGEFCEGAFANGLFDVYLQYVGGKQVTESSNGTVAAAWMSDPDVQRRWSSAIWTPLQDLRSKSPPTTRGFLDKLKSMHPAEWHLIVRHLHRWNMMMAAPTIASVAPASGPASGTVITIHGSEFAFGETTVECDGAVVPATVVNNATLALVTPAGPAGVMTIVVKTRSGTASTTFQKR